MELVAKVKNSKIAFGSSHNISFAPCGTVLGRFCGVEGEKSEL